MEGQDTVVILDSRRKVQGTDSNFIVRLEGPLYFNYLFLKSVVIPCTFYNVTDYNNKFEYTMGGVPDSYTLTPGRYTRDEIVTWLNGIGVGQFTFDANLRKMKMEWLIPDVIIKYGNPNSIGSIIGWFSDTTGTVTDITTAPFSISETLYPNKFHILSTALRQSNSTPYIVGGRNSAIIQTVDINTSYDQGNTVISQDFSASKRTFGGGSSTGFVQDIDIVLQDDRGNPVNLNNPTNGWQLEVVFTKCYPR